MTKDDAGLGLSKAGHSIYDVFPEYNKNYQPSSGLESSDEDKQKVAFLDHEKKKEATDESAASPRTTLF